ncbi:MAG: pyruvate-formate lyase [Gemmatimonadetes bacterium]|nr:pyruvate-formate lyase [Gemmatimonadota bacterium]
MTTTVESGVSIPERIESLRKTKSEFTEEKVRRGDNLDVDDLGYIPWPEPVAFVPIPNLPEGGYYGMRACAENFREWLRVHPVYIHPKSAMAGAWVGAVPGSIWNPDDFPVHLYPLHEEYNILQPGIGATHHFGGDLSIGLDLGWGGLLEKIRRYRDRNRPDDTSFYDGEEQVVLGIQHFIGRHVEHARQQAAVAVDSFERENYLEIAAMNEWLIDGAPRTMREAGQFLTWFQTFDHMWGGGGLGQLDRLLLPFYEADKVAGRIDDEEAIWFLASQFYNDTHYSQIAGPAPGDGHDTTNELSFLILEAMHRVGIPVNIAIRVHDGLNPELLRRAVQYLFEDGFGCTFVCSKGLDEGYIRNGIPLHLARMRAKVGCNWMSLPGLEYGLQDVSRVCLTAPFLHAFRDMMADTAEPSMEALWERYVEHLGAAVDVLKQGFDWHMERMGRNRPELVLNLFCHGTIERGLNVTDGGVDIYNLSTDGVGLATVADSLAAMEQRVVKEQRLTWGELAGVLESDFEGAEDVRLMLSSVPRFGAGGTCADEWAQRVADLFTELMRGTPTPRGYTVIPGLFSHGIVQWLGAKLGATPNGRRKGGPISHNANPDPGFMTHGGGAPTAKSNAVAAVQPKWGNTTSLQLDLDGGLAQDIGGLEAIEALIKGHNDLGGSLINMNVISKEQILEAHDDPSKYPDLIVRVTGYSAYFKALSPEYRQQVVDRMLASG